VLTGIGRHKDGRPVLMLGLSGENVTRLVADEPVMFDVAKRFGPQGADEGAPDCWVVVVYGKTDAELWGKLQQLRAAIGGAGDSSG